MKIPPFKMRSIIMPPETDFLELLIAYLWMLEKVKN